MFHTRRASTSHAEEADEGAERDDDALATLDPVRARPLKDEGTQSLSRIGEWIITHSIEKSHKDALIDVERRLSQSTVRAHPRTEFCQDGPFFGGGWQGYRQRKLALHLEESDE